MFREKPKLKGKQEEAAQIFQLNEGLSLKHQEEGDFGGISRNNRPLLPVSNGMSLQPSH